MTVPVRLSQDAHAPGVGFILNLEDNFCFFLCICQV